MNRAQKIQEVTQNARRSYAERLFHIPKIAEWITDRSANGYMSLRVYQARSYSLQGEPATLALTDWLDAEGFNHQWRETIRAADPLRRDSCITFVELEISWKGGVSC